MLTVRVLESFRRKALRRGLWFRVLSSVERAVVDLCLKVKRNMEVKSPRLLGILTEIIKKVAKALRSPSRVEAWTRGFKAAQTLSRLAVSWGYEKAAEWAQDLNYITYLARAWMQETPYKA